MFMRFCQPCFMLRSTSVQAYMLGSTFFHLYVLSFYMPTRVFPCYMVRSLSSHAYMLGSIFYHILVMPCYVLQVCTHVSMPMCLDLCFHILMCLDLCSSHAFCYLTCACALHAMFVCLDLGYVCHVMCYCCPFCCFFFISYVFGLMVKTYLDPWSLSPSIH